MRVAVLNTGSELLLGQVVNTHLAYLAREIFPLGLRIERQTTVPDGEAIYAALRELLAAEIVFVTGGLGPTTDDITREAVAALLGVRLQRDEKVAAALAERMRIRGFPMTERVLRQADVPAGAVVLPNRNGSAPGLYLPARGGAGSRTPHLFLLPGPPRELQPMFQEEVLPILRTLLPAANSTRCRTFRLACVGESVVEEAVGEKLLALPGIELGYCARMGEVDVRVIGPAATVEAAEKIVREAFPRLLFTTEDEELEATVIRALREKNATLATAESCTGGYLAHRLTNVPGASAVFVAGFTPYANEAKSALLGVAADLIAAHGAVSEEVARAMALGALEKTGAEFALATTGIAGPSGGTEEKPVGTVFIALAAGDGEVTVRRQRFLVEREAFKRLATQHALQMLRERLLR